MLTRLTEEGKGMCYRYWPGEGSELYHIYEVHLVSEHIWCDDYLVRSFYLKNLRTGETRTVTQFHFLSWPENGVPHSTKALLEFRRFAVIPNIFQHVFLNLDRVPLTPSNYPDIFKLPPPSPLLSKFPLIRLFLSM